MHHYTIIMLDWNHNTVCKFSFVGDYEGARQEGNHLLYSNTNYWGYRIEHD